MILKTKFKDLFLIKNNTHKDQRGYFKELIRENKLKKKQVIESIKFYGNCEYSKYLEKIIS